MKTPELRIEKVGPRAYRLLVGESKWMWAGIVCGSEDYLLTVGQYMGLAVRVPRSHETFEDALLAAKASFDEFWATIWGGPEVIAS